MGWTRGGRGAGGLWGLLLLCLLLGVGGGAAVGYVRHAEARLLALPAGVRRELQRHGSRYVPLRQIPRTLIQATVAVEDRSFWYNPGISLEGIARAALVDVASGSFAQGGSTITQELIRDRLLGYQKSIVRKVRELIYAVICTRLFSKDHILAMYLNEVNYGHGAFGVYAASRTYFGVPPRRLDLAQSALLAGLPQDPAGLDPLRHPRAARARRTVVLRAMVAAGLLTPRAARRVAAQPLGLRPLPQVARS